MELPLTKLTRSEQILAEKAFCVLLLRGQDTEGAPIYSYVAVRADQLEAFMEAQKQELFYPDDYGVVIEEGEGVPSEEVQQRIAEEYGFNHEAMIDLPPA